MGPAVDSLINHTREISDMYIVVNYGRHYGVVWVVPGNGPEQPYLEYEIVHKTTNRAEAEALVGKRR